MIHHGHFPAMHRQSKDLKKARKAKQINSAPVYGKYSKNPKK